MLIRLAETRDIEAIVEMGRENMASTRPSLPYSEARLRDTIQGYFEQASPTIFVAEDREGAVVGMLFCDFFEYPAADGLFTVQQVLYVRPENRGTRAAALLMKELLAWSEMLGALEIIGGNDNEFNSDRTRKFLEHFGFRFVGYSMRRAN